MNTCTTSTAMLRETGADSPDDQSDASAERSRRAKAAEREDTDTKEEKATGCQMQFKPSYPQKVKVTAVIPQEKVSDDKEILRTRTVK